MIPDNLRETFLDRVTSRKFIVTVWLHLLSCVLLYVGQLEPAHWLELNTYLVGVYVGANAASKFGEAMKGRVLNDSGSASE